MKAGFTIHEIIRGNLRHAPSSVILDLADAEYEELITLGAIREASEDEVALASPVPVAAVTEAVKVPEVDKKAELLARAEELGLKVRKNASEDVLLAAIHEAEAAAAKAEGTADPETTEPDLLT